MQRILRRGIVVAALLTTITPALGSPALGRPRRPRPRSTRRRQHRRRLARRPADRRPGPQRPVRLRRLRPHHRRRPRRSPRPAARTRGWPRSPARSPTTSRATPPASTSAPPTCTPAPPPRPCTSPTSPVRDPTAFGGADLVARLEGLTTDAGPSAGRIAGPERRTATTRTPSARPSRPSGLDAAGSTEAAAATTYLLDQQCSDGWFRLLFTTDATAADQSCDGGVASGASKADPDTTVPRGDPARRPGRRPDGRGARSPRPRPGCSTSRTTTAPSAAAPPPRRRTATAPGWPAGRSALRGHTAEAERAAVWVRGLQAADTAPCTTALTGETGAIAYDAAAFETGRSDGITDGHRRPVAPGLRPGAARAALGAGRHRDVRRDRADRLRPGRHHGLADGHRARPGRRRVPVQRLRRSRPSPGPAPPCAAA